jgi:eukaryotic-like serine/threonine-protein kinase
MKQRFASWFASETPPDAAQPSPSPDADGPIAPTSRRAADFGLEQELLRRLSDSGEIGRGVSGHVRRVQDRNLLRTVAIKILDPQTRRRDVAARRFIEEAQITAQLDHPNIVPVHEIGVDDDGVLYFTMKLVSGRTFADELRLVTDPRRPLPLLLPLLEILLKVCDAVAFAHSRGVIHRDLKPTNIMVGGYGEVYLMDWGFARLLQRVGDTVHVRRDLEHEELDPEGLVVGSPRYMAPEQACGRNRSVDERIDVFSLGALLYHVLTGRPPYASSTMPEAIVQAQRCCWLAPEEVAPEAALPEGLCAIAGRAMQPDPDHRYPSVLALRAELERFLRGGYLPTRRCRPGERIVVEGDVGDAAYIIYRGRCLAYKGPDSGRIPLRVMGPGEVFGETAVLACKPRTATVEALEDTELGVVTARVLTDGLGYGTWMGAFVRALAERFREADERLTQRRAPT